MISAQLTVWIISSRAVKNAGVCMKGAESVSGAETGCGFPGGAAYMWEHIHSIIIDVVLKLPPAPPRPYQFRKRTDPARLA